MGNGFVFRNWTYIIIPAILDPGKEAEEVYADTGCGVSLVNREWQSQQTPNKLISKMTSPLRVRRVGLNHHEISKYITQKIYLPATDNNDNSILVYLYRELYIINNLRTKILIRNDIIRPKNIIIDIANK